jgi:hypothetical protein
MAANMKFFKMQKQKTNSNPGSKHPISETIKNWTAITLGIISVAAGIWGILGPVKEYIEERKNHLTYELNDNMITFVNDLRSDSTQLKEQALIMLMYYEKNALPILYYKLEKTRKSDDGIFVDQLVDAINGIYNKIRKAIVNEIFVRCDNIYYNLFKYDETFKKELLNKTLYNAITNYSYLLGKLDLTRQDKKLAKDFLLKLDLTISTADSTRTDHLGTLDEQISNTLLRLGYVPENTKPARDHN